MPAITALAALVPCADSGIRQTVRACSPRLAWYAADREQARELTLRSRVGLQRHRVVAGDLAQRALEVVEQLAVARGLLLRARTGASSANSGHVIGIISVVALSFIVHEPERDHRAVEREITVGEAAQVAQHLRLGVVRAEHRMREDVGACASTSSAPNVSAQSPWPGRLDAERPHDSATISAVVVSSSAIADACRRRAGGG